MAQTDLELGLLGLEDSKIRSFVVIATGRQSGAKAPQYYRMDLDVNFRAQGSKDPRLSALQQTIENYKLMVGKDTLTLPEEQLLEMMIERHALGARLTPGKLRMRKALFFMRQLKKAVYQTPDRTRQVRLLVSPLTFLFQIHSAGSVGWSYDHYQIMHLREAVEAQLANCRASE